MSTGRKVALAVLGVAVLCVCSTGVAALVAPDDPETPAPVVATETTAAAATTAAVAPPPISTSAAPATTRPRATATSRRPSPARTSTRAANCHPSYPTVCIPPPPPDLDCGDISYRRFRVVGTDPHGFDNDSDGIGCES